MMQPEADNARPDTAAKQHGGAQRPTISTSGFHLLSSCLEEKLLSRTGADPRAIHLALRRTLCDKLHRLDLGGLTADDLSQYRCRRLYLKRGERDAVRSHGLHGDAVPVAAMGLGDVERCRPGLARAGEITLGLSGTGLVALESGSQPRRRPPKQAHLCDLRGRAPTVGDGAAGLRPDHPADLDRAAVDLHARRRAGRR